MENFATLAQRMVEIRNKIATLGKQHSTSSRNQKVMNLGLQAKAMKERLDKYGCTGGHVLKINVEVHNAGNHHLEAHDVYFVGVIERSQEQWIELIKYRLSVEFGDLIQFERIVEFTQIKLGAFL